MSRQVTVLITAAGGAGTIAVIRTLKELGRYRVIALDASLYAAGFAFADRGYVVPFATDPTFSERMRSILANERPEFIVPLVDEEVPIIHDLVAALQGPQPRVLTPTPVFCAMALDKWRTFEMLQSAGIPTPMTWPPSESEQCVFPAVIKPRDGRGSREVAFLTNRDELLAYLARAPRSPECYVVQKRVIGREYTISCVVGLGGPTLAVVPKEVLSKHGITQVGVTRVAPELERICRDVQDRLRADGPFNVQLIVSQDGVPYIIEINPRYSTTVALTIAAGVHEVDVVIRHALGEAIEPLAFEPNLMMVRYPTQMYVPEPAWPPQGTTARCLEVTARW